MKMKTKIYNINPNMNPITKPIKNIMTETTITEMSDSPTFFL